jgi:ADP-ribose pyrophosphatase
VVGDYDVFKVRRVIARAPAEAKPLEFHVIDTPDCVQTVAITDQGKVIMVEQYRHGIARKSLEFAAGVINDGEDCVAAGLRELEEETGYRPARSETLGTIASDPALNSNRVTIIAAFDCTESGRKNEDEGEAVETRLVEPDQIDALITSGEITHGDAIAAWYLFNRRAASSAARP